MRPITFVAAIGFAFLGMLCSAAQAETQQRSLYHLPTGNGHGFQVYNASRNRITHFLEHPYRYLRPSSSDPHGDGVGRRNLAYDFFFGVAQASGNAWLSEGVSGAPSYLDQTNIIHVPVSAAGISAETYYFAPFGYEGNALIALLQAPAASSGFALFNFHMGRGSPDTPDAASESLRAAMAGGPILVETGPGGGAMVYIPLSGLMHADCNDVYNQVKLGHALSNQTECSGDNVVPAFQVALQEGWLAVAILYVEDPAQAEERALALRNFVGNRKPPEILDAARKEWQAWRKPPPAELALCTDDEQRLWRQSEAVLRMGQVREPYSATRKNYGMILASLPIGEWHTGWVRDAMYAIVALARMGHHEEARLGLEFFINAGPVGKYKSFVSDKDYRISVVRYFGNGEEEADYSGQSTPNIELDGWGLFLWAARSYIESSSDVNWLASRTRSGATVWDSIVTGVAQPLVGNLESSGIVKADSSIWEVHDENKKHFAYTSMAAIRGFCDLAAMAQKSGHPDAGTTYADLAKRARDGFYSLFLDPNGAIAGSTEELGMNQYLDGAVVEAFNLDIIQRSDYGGRTAKATLDLIERLRVESGGFKRNDDGLSSYDQNEWILIDLRMSDALWRMGREPDSKNLLQLVLDKAAANFYLLPELYNAVRADGAVGKYAGSIPMVGYGGGAYILTMLDRSGILPPSHCGDGAANPPSGHAYQCASDGKKDGRNNPGTPGADELSYENACLCQLHPTRRQPNPMGMLSFLFLPVLLFRKTLRRRLCQKMPPARSAFRSLAFFWKRPHRRWIPFLLFLSAAQANAQPIAQPGMGLSIGPLNLRASGYFRAPLRLSFRSRGDSVPDGTPGYNLHTPWLVDDDYFRSGFSYTRLQESDWSELYLGVGNKSLVGEVALMGSLYSDWARPLLDRQWGIAQAFLTFHYQAEGPRLRFRMHIRAGSFWDRFGWLENYDTYLFGRTHQMGGQVRLAFELPGPGLALWIVHGVGIHQDAIESSQGLSLLHYLHSGIDVRKLVQIGFYFLDAQSHDQRQLKEIKDASMRIFGLDARLSSWLGRFYLGGSMLSAAQVQYLSPVIEVMHSFGGRGLLESYLGVEQSDGVGSLWSLGAEYTFSLRTLLGNRAPERAAFLHGGDLLLKFFALTAYTLSKQADEDPDKNRDGRLGFKWGTELFLQPLSFLFAAFRYDRVIPDVQDEASSFRVYSPRIGFTVNWVLGAQIFLQYSRYAYGPRVRLRPGQVALESLPDDNALKLQAQIGF